MGLLADIEKAQDNVLIIFGEMHEHKYIDRENELLEELKKINKVDILLLENAFGYSLPTRKHIQERIKKEDWMLGPSHYEMGIDFNLPIYGIDLLPNDPAYKKSLEESFIAREDRMVKIANKWRTKGNVLLIVGDTHLREEETKELGRSSPLYTKFKNKQNTFIIRADRQDREIDTDNDPNKTYLWNDL